MGNEFLIDYKEKYGFKYRLFTKAFSKLNHNSTKLHNM